jgi:hypothetical protein
MMIEPTNHITAKAFCPRLTSFLAESTSPLTLSFCRILAGKWSHKMMQTFHAEQRRHNNIYRLVN